MLDDLEVHTDEVKTDDKSEEKKILEKFLTKEELLAGKFDSFDGLVKAYKNSAKVYQENQELKKLIEIPETYELPSDNKISEDQIENIRLVAKNSGLSQHQFEKMVIEANKLALNNVEKLEKSKKEIGDFTLNMLDDYVSAHYAPELKEKVMNDLVRNPTLRDAAMRHREQLLDKRIPGMNATVTSNPVGTVSNDELQKAIRDSNNNPADVNLRNKMIDLINRKAKQK